MKYFSLLMECEIITSKIQLSVRPMRLQMGCLQQQCSCNSDFSLLSITTDLQREKSQQDCASAKGCKEDSAEPLPT